MSRLGSSAGGLVALWASFSGATLLSQELSGADAPSGLRFEERAVEAGLDFVLENFSSPTKHMIEPMTGGVAVLDYDGDGALDVYFANGAVIPSLRKEEPKYFNRLYRNLGDLRFQEVTAQAGVAGEGYSMGVAAADYDNDGDTDLFVAGVFHNLLFRNLGNGRFEETARAAGIKSDLWSVAAGWFDYDNDGLLDLFVVNYVVWSPEGERYCGDKTRDLRVYCHPKHFTGVPNQLYRNLGDGSFEDVTESSGIGSHPSRGMSVAFEDYDGDRDLDALVTNDNLPNSLFQNQGDGRFQEVGLLAGVALRDNGRPVSSMGVAFRDYDNDGRPDVAITALAGETFPLFRYAGAGFFEDATYSSRMARESIQLSAWGNALVDFDNDGWKDIFTANSHVNDLIDQFEDSVYKQPNSLFRNLHDGTFRDVSKELGEGFQKPRAHRGSAFGDFDNDGRVDLVVTSIEDQTELFHNRSTSAHHWIRLQLRGTRSNRDGIGAAIRVDGQYNRMTTASGYASSSHSGVHFGLGKADQVERIRVLWPSGVEQVLENVAADQVLELVEPES